MQAQGVHPNVFNLNQRHNPLRRYFLALPVACLDFKSGWSNLTAGFSVDHTVDACRHTCTYVHPTRHLWERVKRPEDERMRKEKK